MLSRWIGAGDWTHEQWLIASMMVFVVIAGLVVAYRTYAIFKTVKHKRERPNLGLRGRRRR